MRLVQQICRCIGKYRDARRAQGGFVDGKITAPAQEDAEIIISAGALRGLVAHGKALAYHRLDARRNGGGIPLGPCAVNNIDLTETAIIGRFIAHHKALAVAVRDAAQPLREEHLK